MFRVSFLSNAANVKFRLSATVIVVLPVLRDPVQVQGAVVGRELLDFQETLAPGSIKLAILGGRGDSTLVVVIVAFKMVAAFAPENRLSLAEIHDGDWMLQQSGSRMPSCHHSKPCSSPSNSRKRFLRF